MHQILYFWSIVVGSQYGNNNKSLQSLILKLMLVNLNKELIVNTGTALLYIYMFDDTLDLGPWNCNFFNTGCLTFSITSFSVCSHTHIRCKKSNITQFFATYSLTQCSRDYPIHMYAMCSLGCVFSSSSTTLNNFISK